MQNFHLLFRIRFDFVIHFLQVILQAFAIGVELLKYHLEVLDRGEVALQRGQETLLHVDQSHLDLV